MLEFVDKIFSNLSDNPYFGAGFGLVGVGAGLAAGRQALSIGLILFRRHCMMTLEITHRDQSYPWILNWLTHHHKKAQHLSVVTQFHQRDSGQFSSKFNFVPSVGTHFFRFNNKWMKVERDRQQTSVDINMGHPFETIKFTCLGQNKEIFSDMLNYAKDLELSKHDGKTVIYEARTSEWAPFGEPRRRRQFESVILDKGIGERILADVTEFLNSRDWYSQRGVPYRRGYLLHGPPGCGKTSYITALAGKLGYDICQLNLSNAALSDERINYLLSVTPPQVETVIEDIDAAFLSRDNIDMSKSAYQGLGRVTLSGILNVLDGVASSEERIIFMTSNYPEKLDPALTRPGRVDMKVYIGYASDEQLAKAFNRFYPPTEGQPDGNTFVKALTAARKRQKLELSMADVQSYFLFHKDKPVEAISNVHKLVLAKASNNNNNALP